MIERSDLRIELSFIIYLKSLAFLQMFWDQNRSSENVSVLSEGFENYLKRVQKVLKEQLQLSP